MVFHAVLRHSAGRPEPVRRCGGHGSATLLFCFLPWLDRSPVKSIRYRGWNYKIALALFTVSFIALGWLGLQPATTGYTWMARLFTLIYFLFFLLMPFYTGSDKDKPVPDRVT